MKKTVLRVYSFNSTATATLGSQVTEASRDLNVGYKSKYRNL